MFPVRNLLSALFVPLVMCLFFSGCFKNVHYWFRVVSLPCTLVSFSSFIFLCLGFIELVGSASLQFSSHSNVLGYCFFQVFFLSSCIGKNPSLNNRLSPNLVAQFPKARSWVHLAQPPPQSLSQAAVTSHPHQERISPWVHSRGCGQHSASSSSCGWFMASLVLASSEARTREWEQLRATVHCDTTSQATPHHLCRVFYTESINL